MVQPSRCRARGNLGGEVGEGDRVVRDDEDSVLVKGLDGLEVEGGVAGPGAGEAGCLGGEGLMAWGRRAAGGVLEARVDEGCLVADLEGLGVDDVDLEVAVDAALRGAPRRGGKGPLV